MSAVAPSRLIVDQHERVADWCQSRIVHFSGWGSEPRAIGLEVKGQLRAGVVYTNYSPGNVFASIAVERMNRQFIFAIFWNPFVAWKVRHITCTIEESNVKSIELCTNMGFEPRGRLPESAVNGEDVIILGMLRKDCRFLEWGP